MQPIFDAQGNPLYLYCISGYEEVTWAVSLTKFSQIELHEALIAALEKWYPVIDALNQESLELFGQEWVPRDDPHNRPWSDSLIKGTPEQYDAFFDKWYATLPSDPIEKALEEIGCELLKSEASAFCSHCCSTAYQCVVHLQGRMIELKEEVPVPLVGTGPQP